MSVTQKREFTVMKDGTLLIGGIEANKEDVAAFDVRFPGLRNGEIQGSENFTWKDVSEPDRFTEGTSIDTSILGTFVDFRKIPEATIRHAGIAAVSIAAIAVASPIAAIVAFVAIYVLYAGTLEKRWSFDKHLTFFKKKHNSSMSSGSMKAALEKALKKLPVEIRGNEYWMTPADSLLTGSCWLVLRFSRKAIKFVTVDQTLDDPEIYVRPVAEISGVYGSAWVLSRELRIVRAEEIAKLFYIDVQELGLFREHMFAGHVFYTQWMMTKLVQASGLNFFAWLDTLEERHGSYQGGLPYSLRNFVIALAESKGLGQAMKNRLAASVIL